MGCGRCLHSYRRYFSRGGATSPLRRRLFEEKEPKAPLRSLTKSEGGVDALGLYLPPSHRLPECRYQNLRPEAYCDQSPSM